MKRRRKKLIVRALRRPFEWFGIALGLVVFSSLTRRGLLRTCDFVAAVMYRFDRRGRKRAFANLRLMYPRLAEAGAAPTARETLLVRRSYRNMVRAVGHAFWTCRDARRRAASAGEVSAGVTAAFAAAGPVVAVSAHLGCWEVLSQLVTLAGRPMMSVAKDIGTGGMTRLLMKARMSIGQEIVSSEGAFRALFAGLRAGKTLGLLVDQPVRPSDGGVWVRFFSRPVPVSAAPAFFAAKGKTPVVVAWSRPLRDGRSRCELVAVHAPEEARDVWRLTQTIASELERVIRRHPSCWLLSYNVFRKVPTAEELAKLEEREGRAR